MFLHYRNIPALSRTSAGRIQKDEARTAKGRRASLIHMPKDQITETPTAFHHRSAGGVVVSRLAADASVALLYRANGEWTLPKGHLMRGESPRDAALREIAEEIGLDRVRIVENLATVEYTFEEPGSPKPHHKEVVFYLALSTSGEIPLTKEDNAKFDGAQWLSFDEALALCTYAEFRGVLDKARKAIRGRLQST